MVFTDFTRDALEAVREMTDHPVEVAVDDQDYCKLLIGDHVVIESHFGKMPTLHFDGGDNTHWTFGTVGDAAAAGEIVENAIRDLTSMARKSIVSKMQYDTICAFTTDILGVR